MLRGVARVSCAPRAAVACHSSTVQFSTRSVLRQPQDNDDRLPGSKESEAKDAESSANPFDSLLSSAKPTVLSSIPFKNESRASSSSSSSTSRSSSKSSKTIAEGNQEWEDLLNDMQKTTNTGNYYDNNRPLTHMYQDNNDSLDLATKFELLWTHRHRGGPAEVAKPSDGRVFQIKPRTDVGRAYGGLMSLLARNSVKRELRLQDRYEKPNQKRRRLRSERHRRRFAAAVREKVQLVMELQARGV